MTTDDRLKKVLSRVSGVSESKIGRYTDLYGDLRMRGSDYERLSSAIYSEFRVRVSASELYDMNSFEEISSCIFLRS